MKKTIILSTFISLLTTLQIQAQTEKYYVMKVIGGTATHGETNQSITTGSTLDGDDPIRFSSDAVQILVYSSTQGRKIIWAEKPQTTNELLYLVSENLFQASDRSSTRSGAGVFSLSDLKQFFCTPGCVVALGDELKLKIPYLKEAESFYYTKYQYTGKPYNIPLPNDEDSSVIFSKRNIFRDIVPDSKRLKVELCFYKRKTKNNICFCDFFLMFTDTQELIQELQPIKHLPCKDLIDEVIGYVDDRFGCAPVRHNVEKWVRTYLCK